MVTHAEAAKKAAARGGFREGGGRKPKLTYQSRELFNIAVDDYWDQVMDQVRGWVEKGDKDMMKYVLDQRIGKAPIALTVDGNLNQRVLIEFSLLDGGRYQNHLTATPSEAGRDPLSSSEIQGDGSGEEIWQDRRLAH